jgi:polysaccharide pyruvyl transferase WcaK-like protein
MASIGFKRGDNGVYPDLMFSLPLPVNVNALLSNKPASKMQNPITSQVIGIGVIEYYGWHNTNENGEELYQQYVTKLGRFVLWLLEKEHVVRILIGQIHDQRAVNDLKAYVERTKPVRLSQLIAEPIVSTEDLFQQIATTDMVVATRFHNVLCSLMLDKPVVSIGYAKKNDVLMAEMGLGEYCQQIEEFDVERLQAQFTRLAENSTQICEQIRAKNIEYRQSLEEQYRQIAQSVQTRGSEDRAERMGASRAAVL